MYVGVFHDERCLASPVRLEFAISVVYILGFGRVRFDWPSAPRPV